MDDFTYLYNVAKAIVILYSAICIGVIIYGIKSVMSKSSLLFQDNGSNYTKPFQNIYYWRSKIFSKKTEYVSGEAGSIVGWTYILLGLFMLSPVIYILVFGTNL